MELKCSISALARVLSRKAEHDLNCLQAEVEGMISLRIASMKERHEQIHRQLTSALLALVNERDGSLKSQHDCGKACDFEQTSRFDMSDLPIVMLEDPDNVCKEAPEILVHKFASTDSHGTHGKAIRVLPNDSVKAPNSTTEKPPINSADAQLGPSKSADKDDTNKSTFKHSHDTGKVVGPFPEMMFPEVNKAHKQVFRKDSFSVVPDDMFEQTYMGTEPHAVVTAPELPVVNWDQNEFMVGRAAISLSSAHRFSNLDPACGSRHAKERQETNRHEGLLIPKRPPRDPGLARRPARRPKLPVWTDGACKTIGALPELELPGQLASYPQQLKTDIFSAESRRSCKETYCVDDKTSGVRICPITSLRALPVMHLDDLTEDSNANLQLTPPLSPTSSANDGDIHNE